MTAEERKLLVAVPHRHTHRGPFEPGPLPDGLLDRLRDDARAEGATLVMVDSADARAELASISAAAGRSQDRDPAARAETRRWSHEPGSQARDGVPAHAFPATPRREAGPLPQRDFDLDRGFGLLTTGGPAPAVTAALLTQGDDERDWLRAGQALQRVLLTAAARGVATTPLTQPLETADAWLARDPRSGIEEPQMILRLGYGRPVPPTPRRPVREVLESPLGTLPS
jgi:nitroreductase